MWGLVWFSLLGVIFYYLDFYILFGEGLYILFFIHDFKKRYKNSSPFQNLNQSLQPNTVHSALQLLNTLTDGNYLLTFTFHERRGESLKLVKTFYKIYGLISQWGKNPPLRFCNDPWHIKHLTGNERILNFETVSWCSSLHNLQISVLFINVIIISF